LTGVIFNAFMQGYLCANSIYVFLIENIEAQLLEFSKSVFSAMDDETGESKALNIRATLE